MSQENTLVRRSFKEEVEYLIYFYRYLIDKEWKDLLILVGINFILGLLPIAIVWFYVMSLNDCQQRAFYGDGTVIIFCFGVLVSFTGHLFEFKNINDNKNRILLYIFLIPVYVIAILFFKESQLNFDRSWEFIRWVILVSTLLLVISLFVVCYLKFSMKFNYSIIHPYKEQIQLQKKEKKMIKLENKSSAKRPKL